MSAQTLDYPHKNPGEGHMALVLLLDTSDSMNDGGKIQSLNDAVKRLFREAPEDDLTRNRLDVCVIEFNSIVEEILPFSPIGEVEPGTLVARGLTHMGEAIQMAVDKVRQRTTEYWRAGTPTYKPWVFMITDGLPCGEDDSAVPNAIVRVKSERAKNVLKFITLAVDGADDTLLKELSDHVVRLKGHDFRGMLDWVNKSMAEITHSMVGEVPSTPALPANTIVLQ
jgi:uncharacterized protein YegL